MMTNGFVFYTLLTLLVFSSLVMILLVLIQRGRGGGLAGAFGGMGGQSALGVRAGDVFTKITIVVAVVWVMVAGLLGISMRAIAENEATSTSIAEFASDADDESAGTKMADESEDAVAPVEAGEENSDADTTDPTVKKWIRTRPQSNRNRMRKPSGSQPTARPLRNNLKRMTPIRHRHPIHRQKNSQLKATQGKSNEALQRVFRLPAWNCRIRCRIPPHCGNDFETICTESLSVLKEVLQCC